MDAVILTWRWQNILSIWIIVIALFLLITAGKQYKMRKSGGDANG